MKKRRIGIVLGSFAAVVGTVCCSVPVGPAEATADARSVATAYDGLQSEFDDRRTAKDDAGAVAVLRRMAELDREHPKLYGAAAHLYSGPKRYEEREALMRSFGSVGPGLAYGEGVLAMFRREDEAAEKILLGALEGYLDLEHLAGQAACHHMLGNLYRDARRLQEAHMHVRSALSINEKLVDLPSVATNLQALGRIETVRGEFSAALEHQERALATREREGDRSGQAQSWQEIGRTWSIAGDHDEAARAFEKALALRRELNDEVALISTLQSLGIACSKIGRVDRSVEILGEAVALAEQLGDERRRGRGLLDLGSVLLAHGSIVEAAVQLEAAVESSRRSNDIEQEALALNRLGGAHLRIGHFSRAAEALRDSLRLARECGDQALEADCLTDLAAVHFSTDDLAQAILYQERACDLNRDLGRNDAEVTGLNNLGAIYYRLGNLETAERRLEETIRLAQEYEHERVHALARSNLALVFHKRKQWKEALAQHEASMRQWEALGDEVELAYSRTSTAETLWWLGRREEASRLLDQALGYFRRTGHREWEAGALNSRARFEGESGDHDDALRTYGEALDLAHRFGFRRQEWIALAGRAAVLEKTGKLQQARVEYLQAIDIVEALRVRVETGELKMHFLARKADLYERAADLQLRLDDDGRADGGAAAFSLTERARARSLLDLLAESRAGLRSEVPPELIERERILLDQISALATRLAGSPDETTATRVRNELEAAEGRLQRLQVEIRRSAPHYGQVVYPEPASLDEVRLRVLAPDETLLSYFVGREHAWLWVADRRGVQVRTLTKPDEIRERVSRFLERAGRARLAFGGGTAEIEALTQAILPAGMLTPGRRLLVAPDGPLHHVPFAALRLDGRYLVEDHEIAVIPSATTLKFLRERPSAIAASGFLGMGDPVAADDEADFEQLTYSSKALQSIAGMFPEAERMLLTGEEFTKPGVRAKLAEDYRYLHFATHSWLDSDNPRLFGLRLSPSPGEGDDLLFVQEVFALRLSSELVVLSACRSGLGEMLRGEGLYGMIRAFLYAGSRSLLVTLWNVDDRSTAEFMSAFYTEIRAGKSVSEALRQTQLGFLNSDRAARHRPYRWAPFVLVGDPVRGAATEPEAGNPD